MSATGAVARTPERRWPMAVAVLATMMAESVISLITAILVIARAINVLPG